MNAQKTPPFFEMLFINYNRRWKENKTYFLSDRWLSDDAAPGSH